MLSKRAWCCPTTTPGLQCGDDPHRYLAGLAAGPKLSSTPATESSAAQRQLPLKQAMRREPLRGSCSNLSSRGSAERFHQTIAPHGVSRRRIHMVRFDSPLILRSLPRSLLIPLSVCDLWVCNVSSQSFNPHIRLSLRWTLVASHSRPRAGFRLGSPIRRRRDRRRI